MNFEQMARNYARLLTKMRITVPYGVPIPTEVWELFDQNFFESFRDAGERDYDIASKLFAQYLRSFSCD